MAKQNATEARLVLELPADNRYLRVLGSCIEALLMGRPEIADPAAAGHPVELAACEIFTNIVEHAYAGEEGRIRVEMHLHPADDGVYALQIDYWDDGPPFQPDTVPAPDLDQVQVHGYGLFLAEQLMDKIHYERQGMRNHWQLRKRLQEQG